jgi:hypothetical protein
VLVFDNQIAYQNQHFKGRAEHIPCSLSIKPSKKCDELTSMPRKSRSAKIGTIIKVVFAEPLMPIGDSGKQKMKTPAPFCEEHLSLFIICEESGTLCNIM